MDVTRQLHGITFTWDARKAATNLRKHGVSLEQACEVFFDPFLQSLPSQDVDGEIREAVIGLTSSWRLLFVAHVAGETEIRIISARAVTATERDAYENS